MVGTNGRSGFSTRDVRHLANVADSGITKFLGLRLDRIGRTLGSNGIGVIEIAWAQPVYF